MDAAPAAAAGNGSRTYQIATVVGLLALAVLTLFFKLDIGFVSITIGLLLTLMAPNLQKRALGQVSWPEIMLIVGVSTYVGVMDKMGTIDFVGHSVAGLTSPMMAALLLCFVGAVVSAFASSTAVLGSLIPLAVPFLQGDTGVSAIGFIAAMAVSSTIVDVSPFSTNGALVLANAKGVDRDVFFRQLMVYGAIVTAGRAGGGVAALRGAVSATAHPLALPPTDRTPMNARPWNSKADDRAARLARASRRSGHAAHRQARRRRSHRHPARSGDRARRPRLPRRQQPEAGRLPGARRWCRSIRSGCTACTWCSRCWRCPSTWTSSRTASPSRLDFSFSGPQGARLAKLVSGGRIEIGAIHTYLELFARYFVDLTPKVALVAAQAADARGQPLHRPQHRGHAGHRRGHGVFAAAS